MSSKCDLRRASTWRMAERRGLARGCSCISVIVSSYARSCKLSCILIAMLVSIQVAGGCSVLKNWGIYSVTESSTVHEVYVALRDGTLEGSEYFEFPAELRDQSYRSFSREESDSRIPDHCGNGEDRGARGAVGRY